MPVKKISVQIVYSPKARQVIEISVELENGATVRDALETSLIGTNYPETKELVVGVWGKCISLGKVLQGGERIEIFRPLRVDPKIARKERFVKQGVKKAGLFKTKRQGAKAGY